MGLPEDEQGLIAAAKGGDMLAFGELVRRHQRAALRVAAIAGADAEDAAQEGFVRAHAALHRFREGEPFRPWLLRIVANTARNRVRTSGRQRALALRAGARSTVGAEGPAEVVVGREQSERLVAALNRLGPKDRLVLAYRWFEGMSETEMAVALGCRPGTVKSRLSRAMARLRIELGEEVAL
jgi:RNA polymerase sigma-70 factor (ECF subfamily)